MLLHDVVGLLSVCLCYEEVGGTKDIKWNVERDVEHKHPYFFVPIPTNVKKRGNKKLWRDKSPKIGVLSFGVKLRKVSS